ncbi:MAG: hypothetical protein QW240_04895 [Candidatus Caldarchaeum sp.]
MAVRDGRTILVEVKSHVRRSDVAEFLRKTDFYTSKTGKTPDRKIIISPYVEEDAFEAARQRDIKIYTET